MPIATVIGRRRAVVAAVAIAALALAACSSGSSSSSGSGKESVLAQSAKVMAGESGTADGTIHLTTGTGKYAVRWKGAFAHGLGTASGHLPGADHPALEVRWSNGQAYLRRTTNPAAYGQSPIGQLANVQPDTAIWTTIPATNIAAQVLSPVSPSDLVLSLSTTGKQEVTDGPKVDGVATRKVVVTGQIGVLFNWVGPKNGVVLLDGKDRARRITVSYGRESVQLDVRYSGAPPRVHIPPASALAAKTPPAPGPIGPFRALRTGNDLGVAWTLQKAPGNRGLDCWRWSSTPQLAVVLPNYSTDTRCLAPADPTDDVADQVNFVLWTDGTKAPTAAVVATIPAGITQATLGFVGGRTEPATITDGLLTWVGSSSEPLGYVGLQSGGTTINCGVGAVSSVADLSNDTLVGDPFHAPWTCQT